MLANEYQVTEDLRFAELERKLKIVQREVNLLYFVLFIFGLVGMFSGR